MKKGIFIIFENNGLWVAGIRRADNQITPLLDLFVTEEIRNLDGQPCEYMLKGDKIVKVGGRNIFQQQKQEENAQALTVNPVERDWRRELRDNPAANKIVNNDREKKNILEDSFILSKSHVPFDTRKNTSLQSQDIENFSLKLNQFARLDWSKTGSKFYFFNPKKIEDNVNGEKKLRLPAFEIKANFGTLFEKSTQISERAYLAAREAFSSSDNLLNIKFRPEWRFVTGLGGHNVYETGITLHHIYGVPYIPASSIKGVIRSWVIFTVPEFNNSEKLALENDTFRNLFGGPEASNSRKACQGKITFFDAMPTQSPRIEPDIMNPHYPKWYSGAGGTAPVDTDNPNPVFFLTVKETPFQFLIGSKSFDLSQELFFNKKIEDWLIEALSEHGIGAKTAAGYGHMQRID
jgi:CRISPR-associated protein Cmr6